MNADRDPVSSTRSRSGSGPPEPSRRRLSVVAWRPDSLPRPVYCRLRGSCIIVTMSGRGAVLARSGWGAFRLIVLALTLVGFVAMHGLASTDGDGTHCDPLHALMPTAHGPVDDMAGDAPATTAAAHPDLIASVTFSVQSADHDAHELMTGCLLALLGALAALVLRLLRVPAVESASTTNLSTPSGQWTARAPPHPLFLSLCVLRL